MVHSNFSLLYIMIFKNITTHLYRSTSYIYIYIFYFRRFTKKKRLQDSVNAKKRNREKYEPKNKGSYEGKKANTYKTNIPTRDFIQLRLLLTYKGQRI